MYILLMYILADSSYVLQAIFLKIIINIIVAYIKSQISLIDPSTSPCEYQIIQIYPNYSILSEVSLILFFTSKTCAPCRRVKQLFAQKQIEYTEIDCDSDDVRIDDYQIKSLPTIVVDHNVISDVVQIIKMYI